MKPVPPPPLTHDYESISIFFFQANAGVDHHRQRILNLRNMALGKHAMDLGIKNVPAVLKIVLEITIITSSMKYVSG
jgi:hypothetical protein